MEENMMNEMQNQTVDAVEEVQKADGPNAMGVVLLLGAGFVIGFGVKKFIDWRKAKKASASKEKTSDPIEGEVIDEK